MTAILQAGADLRVLPESHDPLWDDRRRASYLLRPDVRRPLSVDRAVWPSTSGADIGHHAPWDRIEDAVRRGAEDDGTSVVAVFGVVASDDEERARLVQHGFQALLEISPAWAFLGYDVADPVVSGLSNCGYADTDVQALRSRWGVRLNDRGLFDSVDDAFEFRDLTNERVPEHAPFAAVGLWRVTPERR